MSLRAKKDPLFQSVIRYLRDRFDHLPDKRVGKNSFIKMRDIGLGAFSTFFMQCPSFLQQQKLLKQRHGRSNVEALFGIEHIPSDNYIRHILDEIVPTDVFSVYDFVLNRLKSSCILDSFRFLGDQLLLALDGVRYYSSEKISCSHCHKVHHRNGTITYSHSMIAGALVHPDHREVIPVKPEFIEPQDGSAKQDCERAAIKRWLAFHGPQYASFGVTLLGDDIYACQPVCKSALSQGCHFIFTCKRDSHKTLYEWVAPFLEGEELPLYKKKVIVKGKSYTYQCRYLNEVPLRDGPDSLKVNWCHSEVFNAQGKKVYSGAFVTDFLIRADNVFDLIKAGRTRWKIENEHNNTLKNQGYYLEHNYGHGRKHLSCVLATFIVLSFLLHNTLRLLDKRYRTLREFDSRAVFFNHIKTLMAFMLFSSWDNFMEFMVQSLEPAVIDTG